MISVIIPTYKKKEELLKNLRHNLPYLKDCEVLVVNDDPSESLSDDLKQFPSIKLIENSRNLGFSGSINRGIRASKHDVVFLLNSDVLLHDDRYKSLIGMFKKHTGLFAIVLSQKEKNGTTGGKNRIYWSTGMIRHSRAENMDNGITAWAEGGSSLMNRLILRDLNYFDELYSPFYWEDIDLSYRAWKAGYEVLFNSDVVVTHHHESTIGSLYTSKKIREISYRNQFIFIWKNITDARLILSHVLHLPRNMVVSIVSGEWIFMMAFLKALFLLPAILIKRIRDNQNTRRTDREILNLFK